MKAFFLVALFAVTTSLFAQSSEFRCQVEAPSAGILKTQSQPVNELGTGMMDIFEIIDIDNLLIVTAYLLEKDIEIVVSGVLDGEKIDLTARGYGRASVIHSTSTDKLLTINCDLVDAI